MNSKNSKPVSKPQVSAESRDKKTPFEAELNGRGVYSGNEGDNEDEKLLLFSSLQTVSIGQDAEYRIRRELKIAADKVQDSEKRSFSGSLISFITGNDESSEGKTGAEGWAVVAASAIIGLGAGGFLGYGALEMMNRKMPETEGFYISLFETADQVFDIAPPGTPAEAWLFHEMPENAEGEEG